MGGFRFGRSAVQVKHERSAEEKAMVRRLDMFFMTFGCVSQVIKYLDQMNISNAYVSGMKEDLKLYGNEHNYFTTTFNVAYCIMLVPSQIMLTHVRPSYWLSGLEITWGVITGLMAIVKNAKHVYVLRVFLGLCECSAWPGMMTLLMLWYTPTELAKRMGFYHSCQAIGSMMSGAMQAAIMETLDQKHGIAGWRWLFIINCIITIVWGFLGFIMLPDVPNRTNPRAFWLGKRDAEISMERLARNNRAESRKVTLASFKRTYSGWLVYAVMVIYIGGLLGTYGYQYFSLFLKSLVNADGSKRWATTQVNVIPIGGSAINVVFVWIWAILSDVFQTRWALIVAQLSIATMIAIMMSIWTAHPNTVSIGVAYASYFLNYTTLAVSPLLFSWLSDIIPNDPDGRSLIVGSSVAAYYAISAWSQVLVWPAKQAPHYKYGWQSALAIAVFVIIVTCFLRFMDVRYITPKRNAELAAAAVDGVAADDEDTDSHDNASNRKADVEMAK